MKDIFQNKIKDIKKKSDLIKKCTCKCKKKRKRLSEKRIKKIAKMQNLSKNEFNQIAVMRGLSQKIRRIKNYEDMNKED